MGKSGSIPSRFYKDAWELIGELKHANGKEEFTDVLFPALAKMFLSDGCLKFSVDPGTAIPMKNGSFFWHVYEPFDIVSMYIDHFRMIDPVYRSAVELYLSGLKYFVIRREDVISRARLRHTEFFSGFLKPIKTSSTMILEFNSPFFRPSIVFGVSRELRGRSYSDSEQKMLDHLAPQIADLWNKCDLKEEWSKLDCISSEGNQETAFSGREKEVIWHLMLGGGNKEIAKQLSISYKTVRDHLSSAFGKVGVHSRSQLIAKLFLEVQL